MKPSEVPFAMFLFEPAVFHWDLLILLLLLGSGATAVIGFLLYRRFKKIVALVAGILGLAAFILVFYGSFIEPRILVTDTFSIPASFPDPLRIAVIADLHVGPYKHADFVKRVVDRVNATNPDLILIPGDFVFTKDIDLKDLEPLRNLKAPYGTFAVIGNHDLGQRKIFGEDNDSARQITAFLRLLGVTVLRNTYDVIDVPHGKIAVAGFDDTLWQTYDLDLLKSIPSDLPVILLSHSPDVILNTDSKRAALIVAGHTHGGQIRLPFIGSLAPIPDKLGNRYDEGIFPVGTGTTLAITRGVGESGPRARLFAWPEVMILNTK